MLIRFAISTFLLPIMAALTWTGPAWAEEQVTVVRLPKPESKDDARYQYYYKLLEQSLQKTVKTHGTYRLEESAHPMSFEGRGLRYLKQGREIDVLWLMSCKEREDELLPVRIPLLKGLLGCRVFLIREEDQAKFSNIETLEQLRGVRAGQGAGWPDVGILEANGLEVVIGRNYDNLFSMLERGRFDYFPRGVCEAWAEEKEHAQLPLCVEQSIVLYYPASIYFFVNRSQVELANRIQAGLLAALADGDFDKLFMETHGAAMKVANLENRRVFRLDNPLLPPETPLSERKYWLNILAAQPTP